MEPTTILRADVLDIVFEGRNKEYGAYQLRKTYNRRLKRALGFMAGIVMVVFVTGFVWGRDGGKTNKPMMVDDVTLDAVKEAKVDPPPPPPPPPKMPQQQIEIKQFTPPRIVKDDEKPDPPPEQQDLDDVKIGTVNREGVKDDGVVTPPVGDGGKGVVETPKNQEDDENKLFIKVEVDASFPGGMPAWQRFLQKNLRYPEDAVSNEIQGNVVVRFIVDRDGAVSDVEVVSGPEQGGLKEEAMRVIKKSGRWIPALQNGKYVKAYRMQPITFKIAQE